MYIHIYMFKFQYNMNSRHKNHITGTIIHWQNGRHFPDDIFKSIFLNENVWISIKISLKLVTKGPINNILALVQIMAWRRPGDKPLSEPIMINLPTHICVTRPQWVKWSVIFFTSHLFPSQLSCSLSSNRKCLYSNSPKQKTTKITERR